LTPGLYLSALIPPVEPMRGLLLIVILSLTACGQRGALYLPEEDGVTPVPEVAPEPGFDPLQEAGEDEPEDEAEGAESMDDAEAESGP